MPDGRHVIQVLAHGRVGHQQVVTYQPGYQLGVVIIQSQFAAVGARVLGAEHGMIAAAPLGDIVKQGGQVQQFHARQPAHEFMAQRELRLPVARLAECVDVLQYLERVFIDRVNVKHVELHQPGDALEQGQHGAEQPVAVHEAQHGAGARSLQQFEKTFTALRGKPAAAGRSARSRRSVPALSPAQTRRRCRSRKGSSSSSGVCNGSGAVISRRLLTVL